MISVTTDYETAAKNNYRDPRARIRVVWVDSSTEETITVTSNDENRGAIIDQAANTIDDTTYKWMHCSSASYTNRPILDGTCHPMPSDLVTGEVGWFNSTPADSLGQWVTDPVLTYEFASRAFINSLIIIQCDTRYNEYPTEFTLKLYNGAVLEHTYYNNTNTSTTIEVDLNAYSFSSITKTELIISTWSAPYGIVKINEMRFTTSTIFRGSEIISLNILEETETDSGSLAIGQISSNEISITLHNEDDVFTYGNTDSDYHDLLQPGVRIDVWLGFKLPAGSSDTSSGIYIVETEGSDKIGYYPYGSYWSDDWVTNRRDMTVSTFARDQMERLRTTEFSDSLLYQNVTLYNLADTVMTSAGAKINGLEWEIDSSLSATTIPMAYFEKMSYFDAIKKITQAGQTTAYVNRVGVVIIGATY